MKHKHHTIAHKNLRQNLEQEFYLAFPFMQFLGNIFLFDNTIQKFVESYTMSLREHSYCFD